MSPVRNPVTGKIEYGNPPADLGLVELETGEMMHYLYLPIYMPNVWSPWRIPPRLRFCLPLIDPIKADLRDLEVKDERIVYLTAKTLHVAPGAPGNRPGWHADGYGSGGDLNYIWFDMNPTQFCTQGFEDIPETDAGMLAEIANQVQNSKVWDGECRHLYRLDESVIHRVNPEPSTGVRTFIKISVSRHRYNLKGNSHNYLFDYDWEMHDRAPNRNLDNKDFK